MEEKKTVVETVAVVEKAEVKKVTKAKNQRKPRKPIAATAGKIPAVKTAGQEKPKAEKPAEKVSAELKNMIENVSCLPSFAGREKETMALASAIIAADVAAVTAIVDKLPRAEKVIAISLNNSYAAKKAAGEKAKKASVKLTKEQEERALARTLFEAMQEEWKSGTVVPRKGLKLKKGDLIRVAWLTWKVKAVTTEGVYCEYFEEGTAEAKGIFRHKEHVVIDPPAAWPEDVIVKRVATPAPAGAAK